MKNEIDAMVDAVLAAGKISNAALPIQEPKPAELKPTDESSKSWEPRPIEYYTYGPTLRQSEAPLGPMPFRNSPATTFVTL